MMRALKIFVVFLIIGFPLTELKAAADAPPKVMALAKTTFTGWGNDPIIVKAVKRENAKGKTLEKIKTMDKKWQSTPGIADFMKTLMESECGKHLLNLQKKYPYVAEIFVMDNQGANVAMTGKTSDYWQGDEDKFIKSYNNGKGEIHIGTMKFDDSTQSYLVQVSVPVKDGNQVIGAMTIGVDVEKVE
jgi:hypothetical protein